MTPPDNNVLTIPLLGKQHLVSCPLGQEGALLAAAEKLNMELDEFKSRGQVRSDDKALLMVALNLCHQLLSTEQTQQQQISQITDKIRQSIK